MDRPNRIANIRIGTQLDTGSGVVEPEQLGAPAPLEDRDHHAVRRADGQQVHHAALTGTTTERNTIASSSTETATTKPITSQSRPASSVGDVGEQRGRAR